MHSWICNQMGPMVFKPTPAQVRRDGDFTVAMSLDALTVHLLNPTASDFYEMIDGKSALSELIERMNTRFPDQTRETLSRDLCKIMRDLEAYGLVVLDDSL